MPVPLDSESIELNHSVQDLNSLEPICAEELTSEAYLLLTVDGEIYLVAADDDTECEMLLPIGEGRKGLLKLQQAVGRMLLHIN